MVWRERLNSSVVSKWSLDGLRARFAAASQPRGPSLACSSQLVGSGADGACHIASAATLQSDLASSRGAFVVLVDVRGSARPYAAAIAGELARTYGDIPPDVDRLVALRAALERAAVLAAGIEPAAPDVPARASVLLAALNAGRYAAVNSGDCRAYLVRASGRIDRIRLEPSAQRELEPADTLLLCSPAACEKLEEVELALNAYSREPADAAKAIVSAGAQRGARGALLAVVFGPGRTLREKILGRSSGAVA